MNLRRTRYRASSAALVPGGAGRGRSRPHVSAFDLIRVLIIAFVVGVHTLAIGGGEITLLLGAFIIVFHTSRELFFLLTTPSADLQLRTQAPGAMPGKTTD